MSKCNVMTGIICFLAGMGFGALAVKCIEDEAKYDWLIEKSKNRKENLDILAHLEGDLSDDDYEYVSSLKTFSYNNYPGLAHITRDEFSEAEKTVTKEIRDKCEDVPDNIDEIVTEELFGFFKEAEDRVNEEVKPDEPDRSFADIIIEKYAL